MYLVIYYDSQKKSRQIVKPSPKFAKDWEGLAQTIIAGRKYHSWEIV